MTRLVSDIRPLLAKIERGYENALRDVENQARRNLGSSRPGAVTVRQMSGRMKWRVQANVPYGLIRQWGGVIRPRNRNGYLVFRTRQGNWVRTKTSRQKGTQWLSRAAATYGRVMTDQLRRLG
jgi:hypothetical protein